MMTKEEFLTVAYQRLSKDPMSRVTLKVKQAIEDPKGCIFDTHCHIFDKQCIDEKFFLLRFIKEAVGLEKNDAVDAAQFTPNALKKQGYQMLSKTENQIYQDLAEGNESYTWDKIEEEINSATAASAAKEGFSIGGLWRTLKNIVFKPHMRNILDYYLERIAIKNLPAYRGRSYVTSILLMDLETGWRKKIDKTLRHQINELKELTKHYPLLPFVAVDPRRADIDDENNLYRIVLFALTEGEPFFGIKVYPSLGYLPNDERLRPIFEICEHFNIPVLTHCGGNTISTYENPVAVRNGSTPAKIAGANREEVAYKLNDPANWKPVLEQFPELKLNFGHFGSNDVWEIYPRYDAQKRIKVIIDLMKTYKNVYADFSFNVIDKKTFDALYAVMDNDDTARARTLFGTDFWVVMPSGNLTQAQEEFNTTLNQYMELLLNANPRKYLFAV